MQIGEYHLFSIDTGRFRLDGGAMFGSIPKPLWQKACKADDLNRIELASRVLLLVGKSRRIIVDTGLGVKMGSKEANIYGYDPGHNELLVGLQKCGLKANDITDVILTHLHFDHVGGATTPAGDSNVPTFPKAKHYVQRGHWEHAINPNQKDRAGFKAGDFVPLAQAGLLKLVDGEAELFDNVSVKLVHGHTPSLQLPVVSDGNKTLLCCCDLVPTAAHVKPHYVMAFDLLPVTAIEEKRTLLGKAAADGWMLFLQHDATVTCGMVQADEKGFAWSDRSDELVAPVP